MEVKELLNAYQAGERTPEGVVRDVFDRIETDGTNAWIATRDQANVLAEATELDDADLTENPLYGIPFAVKDNIDYNGLPTTAGCPAYAYEPEDHAAVVDRLIDAGAILIGKTNMDQFATGLVGTRSPYGECRNVHNEAYISGGSSSGSAVAVAREHVAFALGTDTAGSGRVPAAFNGLVGLKPTRGALSTRGVVPACADLDCVSIFAQTTDDALRVEDVAARFDPDDPYSRRLADDLELSKTCLSDITIGVPAADELEFFGDNEAAQLFDDTIDEIAAQFGEPTTVDFTPFRKTAELLYGGPWVADRLSAVGEFIETHPDEVNTTVADIIRGGKEYSAVDTFEAFDQLKTLRREAEQVLAKIDALVVPTTGTTYMIEAVQSNPIELNSNLGYYTNFVNLLDLSAVAVPTHSFDAGPSFGVTIIGEAFEDARIASIGAAIESEATRPTRSTTKPISSSSN
ncbi:allophanate hydrolase [Natronorubrum daqingense]|uniref:Allophanate hydrolase n=1 Tax=Natronorubrum daqingense TaxID=588898 RepID=A0A1N7G1J4_9EURY|nr:allophanate hydrolase [Natronorubrum daqingense]APX98635.1 allophanate hydrolase [Natronorubrum daqingense]SIS06490.1 allophanate hydrolase [Natronorubrum daqingense]